MNQPTAPCSPPRTNSRARRGRSRRSILSGRPEPDQRHDEGQPDQPAPQPMDPFQPEDLLEAGEAEALVHQAVLRDLLVEVVQPLPFRVAHRRQRAGESGAHSMMERPEPVRRVTPPSTIITRTMAATRTARSPPAAGCDRQPRGLPAAHRESRERRRAWHAILGVPTGPRRILRPADCDQCSRR